MSVKQLFHQVHNIPSIPKVVQELIDNFNKDEGQASDISKKLQMDQALSLKVMRLANSARYGAGRKVETVDSAIVMLGLNTLKTLVIASGVISACKTIPGLDQKAFWRKSFTVANIAKLVAKLAKKDGEVAFTCGLLHNIGDTLLYLEHPDKMKRIDALVADGASKWELQRNQFGYDYLEVGSELTRIWNFPPLIVNAIKHQAKPDLAEQGNDYAGVLYIATWLNQQLEDNNPKDEMLKGFPTEMAAKLGVDMLSLFEQIAEYFDEEDDLELLIA